MLGRILLGFIFGFVASAYKNELGEFAIRKLDEMLEDTKEN